MRSMPDVSARCATPPAASPGSSGPGWTWASRRLTRSTFSISSRICSIASRPRVSAVQRDFLGRGLDDLSVTVVHYGDVPVIVEASYFTPGTWRECVVVGERGALVADYATSVVTLHLGEHRQHGAAWEAVETGKEELPTRREEPLRLELQAFLDACAGRASNPVPALAGVRALEVVEAAERSARSGAEVALTP